MADLTDAQRAQVDNRNPDGKWREGVPRHVHSQPAIGLDADGNGFRDPAYPLTVTVVLERWNYRDEAEEVGTVEFDARAIFDGMSLDEVREAFDNDVDWLFHKAITAGFVEAHDGPFTVREPDELDDYIEHRENNGMADPYENADEILAAAVLDANRERRAKALDEAQRLLVAAGPGAIVTKKVADLDVGDVLVQGTNRLRIEEQPGPVNVVPGFWSVGTEFGYLYLDPDETIDIEGR